MAQLSPYEYEAIKTMALIYPQRDILLAQLALADCVSRDHTGVGLYTNIVLDPAAPRLNGGLWKIEDMPKAYAQHPELDAGAGLILWLKDGYMCCLESYTYGGEWPSDISLFKISV